MSGMKSSSLTEEKSKLYARLVVLYIRNEMWAELEWVLDSMEKDSKSEAIKILGTSEVRQAMLDALRVPLTTDQWCVLFKDNGRWHYATPDESKAFDSYSEAVLYAADKLGVTDDDINIEG